MNNDTTDRAAWGVKVRRPNAKRSEWLRPNGYTTSKRIHASMNWGEEGREKCERVAAEIEKHNPGYTAKAAKL